jgi:hypothetical protein
MRERMKEEKDLNSSIFMNVFSDWRDQRYIFSELGEFCAFERASLGVIKFYEC